MPSRIFFAASLLLLFSILASKVTASDTPTFASEIRPILSDHCFACHGPDEHDRQGGLRLDTADGIASVVEDSNVEDSELVRRLHSDDADELMPPPEFNKPLTDQQKATLEQWIAAGGKFEQHWSFNAPVKAPLLGKHANPIDSFIDQAIKQRGLTPGDRAGELTLLRRVCLDLIGLPPTREQIQRVRSGQLNYETLVDELLMSPEFGQHFGRFWLDLVRYADTHGLHLDNYREMWPYRDWVIDAINRGMPYDQFITEQLAGDLLPAATQAQKIASGFNRLNVTTSEGGSIYDEVFARNVIDRTDAFGTIFMGLTTQCAVCHDHKFDPISQKEYYSLFAFFNSLDGKALDGNIKDHPPVIRVPSEKQSESIASLKKQIESLQTEMRGPIETVDAAQRDWEQSLIESADVIDRSSDKSTIALHPQSANAASGALLEIDESGIVRQTGTIPDRETHTLHFKLADGADWKTIQMDALPEPKTDRPGSSANGNVVLSEIRFATRSVAGNTESNDNAAKWESLEIEFAIASVEQTDGPFAIENAIDNKVDATKGWAVDGHRIKGGRTAWFSVPDFAKRLAAGHNELRVQLEYQSVHKQHQFAAVGFQVSSTPAQLLPANRLQTSSWQIAAPFKVESAEPGFSRKFASQETKFKSDETFVYEDQNYSWKEQANWGPVSVNALPSVESGVSVNVLHQTIESPRKQAIELLLGSTDGHAVFLNEKLVAESRRVGEIRPLEKVYPLELKKGQNDIYIKTVTESNKPMWTYALRSRAVELPHSMVALAKIDPESRSNVQAESLRVFYRLAFCEHPDWTVLQDLVRGSETEIDKIQANVPTTLVWKETSKPREAKLLKRGQYDQPGEVVQRGTPSFLPPMPENATEDRLGLAKWLVSAEHPLTARVAINRYWQSLFGTGLVKSSEDFGSQGDVPSHPALLDWLAVDFRESGWDVKRMVKLMVTSDAYCREAVVRPAGLKVDPTNRYYARGPRHRLDAEVLRDQSLALAGLLNLQSGGPSVKPPQPAGLWYAVGYTRSDTANFKADPEDEKRLRRSVYIFWKRTSAPPQMSTFDAPSRESCTARRERTNTPMQALLLMNETQYLRASKHLAARTINESPSPDVGDQLRWIFETAAARQPSEEEVAELAGLLNTLKTHYQNEPTAASDLLSVDNSVCESLSKADHAAWMVVANTVLNLDEVVNK